MLEKLIVLLFLLLAVYMYFTRAELEVAKSKLAFYKEASEKLELIEASQKRQIEQLAHELESKFREIELNEEKHISNLSDTIGRMRACSQELPTSKGDETSAAASQPDEETAGSSFDRRIANQIGRVLQNCRRTNEQLILLQKYVSENVL